MDLRQNYEKYTESDFEVWKTLYERQTNKLLEKSHPEYVKSLENLSPVLSADFIPDIAKLNSQLKAANSWTINIVPGLIEVDQFFEFLSRKKFCSSTWLRDIENLEYLEEPDMFHDIFGHIPLLMNTDYAKFVETLGKLGTRYSEYPEILTMLQRLYWFTIEFGLIEHSGQTKIYGAGIISSLGEANRVFNDEVEIKPFDVKSILKENFTISEMQSKYYIIDSFSQLYNSIGELEKILNNHAINDSK